MAAQGQLGQLGPTQGPEGGCDRDPPWRHFCPWPWGGLGGLMFSCWDCAHSAERDSTRAQGPGFRTRVGRTTPCQPKQLPPAPVCSEAEGWHPPMDPLGPHFISGKVAPQAVHPTDGDCSQPGPCLLPPQLASHMWGLWKPQPGPRIMALDTGEGCRRRACETPLCHALPSQSPRKPARVLRSQETVTACHSSPS